jgi:LysM repeat protein
MRDWQDGDGLSDEQACSDCLLQTLQHDQASPFSYSGEFASDFSSLTSSCGKSGYEPTTPTTIALNSTKPTSSVPTQVCPPPATYTLQADDTCNGLCIAHNVSTYFLLSSNGLDAYCRDFPGAGTEICLPPTCDVYTVQPGDNCRSVTAKQPGISITQLQAWNPNLNPLCTNMDQQRGMQICVSPPNSTLHTPENGRAAASSPTSAVPEPTNVANATNTQCGRYYLVQGGDTCADISVREGISLPDFYFLNKGVNSDCTNLFAEESYCVLPVGDIADYPGYGGTTTSQGCAGPGSPSTCYGDWSTLSPTPFSDTLRSLRWRTPYNGEQSSTSHTQPTTSSTTQTSGQTFRPSSSVTSSESTSTESVDGVATPTPVQDGMADGCTAFYKVQSGDGCWAIANDHDISLDDFYSWNPAIGDDCSKLYPDVYVCISQSCDVEVTFETTYSTEWGESVWVVGSLPELGEWDTAGGLLLEASAGSGSSTIWRGTASLPPNMGVGFKFFKLQTDGAAVWEEDPNRGFDTPSCGSPGFQVGGQWHGTESSDDSNEGSACTTNVTFETALSTEFGESVWVVGSLPELGEWDVSKGFMLTASSSSGSPTAWTGTLSLPSQSSASFKFVKLQTDGTPVWEDDPDRNLSAPGCSSNSVTVGGEWHVTCEEVGVVFEVESSTSFGEAMYVVGSVAELGAWDSSKAFALSADDYTDSNPLWRATIVLGVEQAVEYKFIKLRTDGGFLWEQDPNRGFTVPTECDASVLQSGTWRSP